MKLWVVGFILASIVSTGALAAAKGPEVDLVDNKLSIDAEAISLSRLLQLVDLATGMKSKVPAELANRNISVKFSNLDVTDGVRKMFQGQPFDYVVIQGQGIIVKAVSQTPPAGDPAPAPVANNPPPPVQSFDQPFVQDFPPAQPAQIQQQPLPQVQQQPMVQTPFGPIPNPRAQQPVAPAIVPPAQQNTLFPNQPVQPNQQQIGQPVIGQPVPGFPTTQPNNANPFGTPTPFGTPNAPTVNQNNPNGLFGSVPVFNSPGTQQR